MRAVHRQTARGKTLRGSAACIAAATLFVAGCDAEREPRELSRVELATVARPEPELVPVAAIRIALPSPGAALSDRRTLPPPEETAKRAPLRIAALDAAPLEVAAPIALAVRPPLIGGGSGEPAAAPPSLSDGPREDRLAAVQPHAFRPDERAFVPQISDTVRTAYIAQLAVDSRDQRLAVRAGGDVLGAVEFQVADGRVSVHIGQVLDLFKSQLGTARFAELRGSAAASEFVSLDRLQGAGIPLEYDPVYDELVLERSSG